MFRSVIMKLAAVCNLNCVYCYMFNQADLTYTRVPNYLPADVALTCLDRIEEHLIAHDEKRFHVALHGGEPTLWPVENYKIFLDHVAEINAAGLDLRVTMQTNAQRMPDRLIALLAEHDVHIGISVDGPKIYNDKARITHAGTGSYDRIMSTVESINAQDYGHLLNGFLCVAPVSVPSKEFLDWVDQLPIRDVDVLWPMEFHHGNPPWAGQNYENYAAEPRIGKWFAELFLHWWNRDDPTLKIRLFEDCIAHLLGARQHVDNIVNDGISAFVLNTDGAIEYHDYFRPHADGACRTTYNIVDNTLDSLLRDPGFDFCLNLGEHLPSECTGCPHETLCGGGFLPGRFDTENALPVRRSILCTDQYYLFSVIRSVVMPYVERYTQHSCLSEFSDLDAGNQRVR